MPWRSDNQPEPLLVDRAAAAEIPSADSVREWARDNCVFVSSVMSELAEEATAPSPFSARSLQRVRPHISRLPRERRAGDPGRGISNRIHGIGIFFCS